MALALLGGLLQNKVLWLSLGIAILQLSRHPSPRLRVPHLLASMPALLAVGLTGGILPWIALSLSLTLLLLLTPRWGEPRIGVFLALAAALHKVAVVLIGELGGDEVLRAEAQLAGLLAGFILPGLAVEGNALQLSQGHMVVLVWGCSSLTNLGDALLLFWALVSIRLPASLLQVNRATLAFYSLVLAGITIALNGLRMILMASNPDIYSYLHGSEGSGWFRFTTLAITALMGTKVLSK